jgi:hypothetical protein
MESIRVGIQNHATQYPEVSLKELTTEFKLMIRDAGNYIIYNKEGASIRFDGIDWIREWRNALSHYVHQKYLCRQEGRFFSKYPFLFYSVLDTSTTNTSL